MITTAQRAAAQAGATLIELVVTIMLTAIIAAVVGQVIARPLQAYDQLDRRARLVATAQAALDKISRELHSALPNSLRIGCAGACLAFLPMRSGAPAAGQTTQPARGVQSPGPVAYLCDPASGGLRRYWGHAIRAGHAGLDGHARLSALPGVRWAPLAEGVEACDFSYRPGDGSRGALLRLSLGLKDDSASGHRERIVLLLQVQVAGAP